MFLNFFYALLSSPNTIYPFLLQCEVAMAILIIIGYWIFFVFKKPLSFNVKIEKETKVFLFILLFCFLIINFNFHSFKAADEEWGSIYRAQTMISGNQRVYFEENSGIVFPLLVAGILKLHFPVEFIRIYNIIIGTISVLLIFECALLIFENDKIALLGSLIYIITPWSYLYTGVLFGLPTLVHFLSLLSLLFIILAFKYSKFSFHILSLISLLILNQTKLEYLPYYFIYLILFFINKEYRKFTKTKIIIFIAIAFLCFVPAIIKNGLFKISFLSNPNFCGFPAQTIDARYSYGAIIEFLDNILKKIINNRIAFSYLLGDTPLFIKFWGQKTLIIPSILCILGIFISLKRKKYKKIILWLPIIFFLILAMDYLLDCGWYEARHAISSYGFISIFSGYSLYWTLNNNIIKRKLKYLLCIICFVLLCSQAFVCFNGLEQINDRRKIFYYEYHAYYLYKDLFKDIPKKDALFIGAHNVDKNILRVLGYRAESFADFIKTNEIKINYEKTIDKFFSSDIVARENIVYFVKSPSCYYFDSLLAFCQRAQTISPELIKEGNWNNEKIQVFILQKK